MLFSNFIHQKSYEQVVKKVRRHPLILVPGFLLFFVLLGVPVITIAFLKIAFNEIFSNPGIYLFSTLFASVYYLSIGIFYYTFFINYYLDILVLTNDRLMHILQEGIFSRSISEVDLYRIQDITSTVDGFFPSMFNYGNLLIQTAGTQDKFTICNVPNPEHLRQLILNLAEEDRKFHHNNLKVEKKSLK